MPLPLIVPIVLGAAGLFGAGKGAKAVVDNKKANNISKSAQLIVSGSEEKLDSSKTQCNSRLHAYGEQKIQTISNEIQTFVNLYSKLKNVAISNSPELDRLLGKNFTEVNLSELKHSCSFASEFFLSATAGAGAGALTAFGAYNGTMLLASAGTGTAISSLSGVTAANATLAWLGGGTLAAGGYGVAGGTMVLGVLVAGPALLILGSVMGARASKKLDEARSNMEKAKTFEKEADVICDKLQAIIQVTNLASDLLEDLAKKSRENNILLSGLINQAGVDYSKYSQNQQEIVFQSVKYIQLVKQVIDTPILNEDGSVNEKTLSFINEAGLLAA